MPELKFEADQTRAPDEQPGANPHNRWHPDVPAVASVESGDTFRLEMIDWTGGQIGNNDKANEIRDVELEQVHYLSGPVDVKGAEPGDLLKVELLDLGPSQDMEWGFTGIFSQQNGGGFLTDHFPDAAKTIWDVDGTKVSSRHVPDVNYEGKIHPGLIGTAPSHELLEEWNEREQELIDKHTSDPESIPNHPTGKDQPPVANPPTKKGALMGEMEDEEAEEAAEVGARTVPGRENGGNCDIKELSLGSTIYFPVYVEGAKLSMGDMHASQGDGEISFCGGIEMAGFADLRVEVIKDGMEKHGVDHPIFQPGHRGPNFSDWVTFEGYSVREDGEQTYMNAHVSYRRAALEAIEYLKKFGYTGEQAYMMLSTIPIEGRMSGIVDVPNAVATISLPNEVFEFDITPESLGESEDRGQVPLTDDPLK